MDRGAQGGKRRDRGEDNDGLGREPEKEPFQLSPPRGWQVSGGLIGRNSTALAGAAHILSGKLDLVAASDSRGTVRVQWVPELGLLQGPGTLPPQAGTTFPTITAVQFIQQVLFPALHPESERTAFTLSRSLPQAAQPYQQRVLGLETGRILLYDAALCGVTYREGGFVFEERLFTLIEIQASHTGLKGNRETVVIRAPLHGLHQWLPALRELHRSLEINEAWLKNELSRQLEAGLLRAGDSKNIETLTEKLLAHQAETQGEIRRQLFS